MYTCNIYIVTNSASDLKTIFYILQILFNKANILVFGTDI